MGGREVEVKGNEGYRRGEGKGKEGGIEKGAHCWGINCDKFDLSQPQLVYTDIYCVKYFLLIYNAYLCTNF